MNAANRVANCLAAALLAAALLAAALVAYAVGYYFCIHRHYGSIATDVDYVFVDENTYTFFRPAVWVYEQTTRREVALNPMIHPTQPD